MNRDSDMPDPVELTQKLVRMDTINPPGNEAPVARYIGSILERAGIHVSYPRLGENRTGLIAEISGESDAPPLVFTGHLDTVPVSGAPWDSPPLKAEIRNGRMYGRGTSDMKSGIAAMVVTALHLARESRLQRGVIFVFTAGEETGCEGAVQMKESGFLPREAGAMVVAEPSGNVPFLGHKGTLWLECTATGKSAHGSMPHLGENAIYRAARAALSLEDFFASALRHPQLGKPTLNVGTFTGGAKINMVPDMAKFQLDIRTVPGVLHSALKASIISHLGPELSVQTLMDHPHILTSPDDPWIKGVLDILESIQGSRPEVGYVNYFTDGSAMKPAMGNPPTLILGPGEPSQAHQTNEFCFVDKIIEAVEIYKRIADFCCFKRSVS